MTLDRWIPTRVWGRFESEKSLRIIIRRSQELDTKGGRGKGQEHDFISDVCRSVRTTIFQSPSGSQSMNHPIYLRCLNMSVISKEKKDERKRWWKRMKVGLSTQRFTRRLEVFRFDSNPGGKDCERGERRERRERLRSKRLEDLCIDILLFHN